MSSRFSFFLRIFVPPLTFWAVSMRLPRLLDLFPRLVDFCSFVTSELISSPAGIPRKSKPAESKKQMFRVELRAVDTSSRPVRAVSRVGILLQDNARPCRWPKLSWEDRAGH